MTTCGEMLMEILESYGVDTEFGLPGVHTLELYRGLQRADIRHVTPRHEQGAGFMADGYARITGKPGVCLIITGPGMTNITTAMGQAYGDSIPMLVISSTNAVGEAGLQEGHLHELRQQRELVAGVAAFSQTVLRPEDLPGVIARAFAVFNGGRPRPVHIEIPIDIFARPSEGINRGVAVYASRPGPAPSAIAQAADWLAGAKSPVILLGGGTVDAAQEAQALVERLGAPTALTGNAKGVLPPGHALSCSSYIPYPPMRKLLAEADVVLAVGTEMGETDYDIYRHGMLLLSGKLIRIDIEPDQTARNYRADLAITSDAALALAALDVDWANGGSRSIRRQVPRKHKRYVRKAKQKSVDGCQHINPGWMPLRQPLMMQSWSAIPPSPFIPAITFMKLPSPGPGSIPPPDTARWVMVCRPQSAPRSPHLIAR
jgi:acetolactate synthase-1/2/3 large subunit